jgi:hypothetical protein
VGHDVAVIYLADKGIADVFLTALIGLGSGEVGAEIIATGDLHPVDLCRVGVPPAVDRHRSLLRRAASAPLEMTVCEGYDREDHDQRIASEEALRVYHELSAGCQRRSQALPRVSPRRFVLPSP